MTPQGMQDALQALKRDMEASEAVQKFGLEELIESDAFRDELQAVLVEMGVLESKARHFADFKLSLSVWLHFLGLYLVNRDEWIPLIDSLREELKTANAVRQVEFADRMAKAMKAMQRAQEPPAGTETQRDTPASPIEEFDLAKSREELGLTSLPD